MIKISMGDRAILGNHVCFNETNGFNPPPPKQPICRVESAWPILLWIQSGQGELSISEVSTLVVRLAFR